jgi:hypothetical protein
MPSTNDFTSLARRDRLLGGGFEEGDNLLSLREDA